MKTKLRKSSKYLATAVFVAALVMNIFTSLTDPFGSSTVFAYDTYTSTDSGGTDGTGGTGGTDGGTGIPTCAAGGCDASSCSYSGTITVMGSGVQVSNSVSCVDAWACCHITAYCFSKSRC